MGAAVTPLFAVAARPLRHATGDRWFVDETYVKVAGRWRYLYRAVDQYGQVIDVLLSEQRDTAAARRFPTRGVEVRAAPVEVTTDKAGPYRGTGFCTAGAGRAERLLADGPVRLATP